MLNEEVIKRLDELSRFEEAMIDGESCKMIARRLAAAERLAKAVGVYRAQGGGDGRYTAMCDAMDAYRALVPRTPDAPADAAKEGM